MNTNTVLPLETYHPADRVVTEILSSYNYEQFTSLEGNRTVNKSNLMRITQSMKEKHLISPVMVNEKFEIIDGQHRFNASKELGLPIYYYVVKGMTLLDVQRMNAVSKNWNFVDFLESYCELGYPEYLKVRRFRQDFPDFGIKASMSILSLKLSHSHLSKKISSKDGKNSLAKHSFSDGSFECVNIKRSYELASQLMQLKQITDLYNKSNFVSAFIQVSRKKDFEFKNFKYKAQRFPSKFYDCTTTQNFVAMFEELYNYKNRKKINLRF